MQFLFYVSDLTFDIVKLKLVYNFVKHGFFFIMKLNLIFKFSFVTFNFY